MNDIKPKLMGGIGEINFGKQYRQWNQYMTLLQSPCVFWLNQSETLVATVIYIL